MYLRKHSMQCFDLRSYPVQEVIWVPILEHTNTLQYMWCTVYTVLVLQKERRFRSSQLSNGTIK